ncbi:MAG: alkaline phosphatase family protein [Candidatus Zipacnadales bacterium]
MLRQSPGAKILIIGIDSACPHLTSRWVAEGKLPHLASLAERGRMGPLRSTPNFLSCSAWSTFLTGLLPGNHGIFYFRDREPGTYRTFYGNAATRDGICMWSALTAAGKRVASLFVPTTWPAVPINGVMASDWLAPSLQDPAYAYPREYVNRILEVAPGFRLHSGMKEFVQRGEYDEPFRRKVQLVKERTDIAVDLLDREYWDLFMIVYHEVDPVQHFFWHFQDPNHPDYNAPGANKYRDKIFEIYKHVDDAVGVLLKRVGEDSFVFIVSDHGAGPNTRGHLYLKRLLRHVGLEVPRRRMIPSLDGHRLYRTVTSLIPTSWRHRFMFRHRKLRASLAGQAFEGDIDWSRTQVYTFYCGGASEPWLNVRGRDPAGIVEPGEEYERVVERFTEVASEALDPATGQPVVRGVRRKEELYSGRYLDRAPDLFVEWDPHIVVKGLQVGKGGPVLEVPVLDEGRTGDHRPYGVYIVTGPQGTIGEPAVEACIADIAPTVYGLLNLPPPHPLDGRPWTELFPTALHVHPPERDEIYSLGSDGQSSEAEIIEKRLEDLGYL